MRPGTGGVPDRGARRGRWLRVLGLLALTALALWARLTVLPEVFVGDHVLTRDPDAHYHLRRIAQTLESFPHVPASDPALNWPEGAPLPWAPGFDWLAAVFAAGLGGSASPAASDRAAAFFPVLLGVLLVWATVALARRVGPPGSAGLPVALAAGFLASLLPRMVMSSQLGRVDHHVFEALAMLGLGLWVLLAAAEDPDRPHSRSCWLRFEAVGAVWIFAAGVGFSGSILYAAISAMLLMGLRVWEPEAPPARRGFSALLGSGAPAFALAGVALLVASRGAVAEHGLAFSFKFPSYLQPLLLGLAGVGCAGAALAASVGAGDARPAHRRSVRLALLAVFGLTALGLAAPVAGNDVAAGLREWLAGGDPWLAGIDEFQPLLTSWALWRPEPQRALYDFNALPGLLAPLVLPLGLWRAWRARPVVGACFAAWTLCLAALALNQNRFAQVLSPSYAVCLALALSFAAEALARWMRGWTAAPRAGGMLAVAVAALCLLDPAIRHELRWHPPRGLTALESVSLALAEQAWDPTEEAPGVLARWTAGPALLRLGGRPVLTAGFGPYTGEPAFRAAEGFMRGSEPQLLELMERRRLSWVVTGMEAPLPASGDALDSPQKPFVLDSSRGRVVASRSYFASRPLAPLILGGGGLPELGIPHVGRLMPRFVSPQKARGLGFPLHRLWLYERVRGARLVGRAPPGARVEAGTTLWVYGAPSPWTAWGYADAGGRFELVVPLPNRIRTPALASAAGFAIRIDGVPTRHISVSESDVRNGTRLDLDLAGSEF